MLNQCAIMGRLVADPDHKRTQAGLEIVNMTVAVDRDYSGKGEEKKTDFIPVTAWRNTAAFIEKYFRKGDMIVVVGSFNRDSYVDKEGNKRTKAYITAQSVYFGQSKRSGENAVPKQAETGYGDGDYSSAPVPDILPSGFAVLEDDDSDLPF